VIATVQLVSLKPGDDATEYLRNIYESNLYKLEKYFSLYYTP